jgi:hypothetical protein
MAKLTLSDITNPTNQTATANTINNNNALVEAAIENTLSRDGSTPNSMSADLDMNGNNILNLPEPVSGTEPWRKQDHEDFLDDYDFSALASAVASADASATSASSSASAASTSASNAAASASAASTSASDASTSASNASTSATNASNSASAAASSATTASNNATVIAGGRWAFAASTVMGDPGSGVFRFNNATVSSVTAIAVDSLSADLGNPNLNGWLVTWDDSTNTNKGQLTIRKLGTPATFAIFDLTAVTDNTGWVELTVSHVTSSGTWTAADEASFVFTRTGDKGVDGSLAGPGVSVDSEVAIYNGTSGATLKRASGTGYAKLTAGVLSAQAVPIPIADGGTNSITAAGAFTNLKQAASDTATGVVELATDAETQTGTDTARAITPANLTAKEATAANYRANTADRILTTDIVWSAAGLVTLTDAATVAVDMSTGINFTLTLGGNRALGAPSNTKVGQTGTIIIKQDGTGSRTLSFNAVYKFAGGTDPTLSTAASSTDILTYFVESSTIIHCSFLKGMA